MQNTKYDQAVDEKSINPGFQMFEKRVSGMFLGEIFRQTLVSLAAITNLFSGETSEALRTHYGIDTSAMSAIATDTSPHFTIVGEAIASAFQIRHSSVEDRQTVKLISDAIVRRSARLAAVAVSAVCDYSGRFGKATIENPVDVGADGSLVEFYPDYVPMCLAACDEILGHDASKRIRIGLAKDGSGVGAAL
jgi:hexokinase